MRAEELFVFVGAGASQSAPTALPTFNEVRDSVLRSVGLGEYVQRDSLAQPDLVKIAAGIFPERFLLSLHESGFDLEEWLGGTLNHVRPNAAHHALAHLAIGGAKIWTVNYDHNIEEASSGRLRVVAWPEEPKDADLLKPHGTLGGRLIATAEQVVRGLDEQWRRQLEHDLSGRATVVFLGYSGRDLDFHPYWDSMLSGVRRILWFDFPDEDGRAFKRTLLSGAARRGALSFPGPFAPPPGIARTEVSPCWDFVYWCHKEGLAEVPADAAIALFDEVSTLPAPALVGDLAGARAALLGTLGAYRRQRHQYGLMVLKGRHPIDALSGLATVQINHGGWGIATLLAAGRFIPPVRPRVRQWREVVERKRLTALSKVGDHRRILNATATPMAGVPSTYLILRAESLRMLGSLTEAVKVADAAYRQALTESHNVRIAHAAYQKVQALVWADRIEEARHALNDELEPYAVLAASRWVAWASFLRSAILVRDGDIAQAREQVGLAVQRFQGEALIDGVVSAELILLTVARREGDNSAFVEALEHVRERRRSATRAGVYYTRGHPFTDQVIQLEEAEFARTHTGQSELASTLYHALSASEFPLHVAFGHLGCALLAGNNSEARQEHLEQAEVVAQSIGQELIRTRCTMLTDNDTAGAEEMFFC